MLESIAFIPDGNRRFARTAGINFLSAYQQGTQKAWNVMHWLEDYPKIKSGTFWMLSLENMQKRRTELSLLFRIFDKELDRVKSSGYFEEKQIRLRFFGRLDLLPKKLFEKIGKAEEITREFKASTINLALGYSGRAEIVDAAKKIALEVQENKISLDDINETSFEKYLYSDLKKPDLVIRTSGEQRTSGFLPFQTGYSELYFCKHCWPEFSKNDLAEAINDFDLRKRNFGK